MFINEIRKLTAFKQLCEDLQKNKQTSGLGLLRSVRLPVAIALQSELKVPILYLIDRSDHALIMLEEISFWSKLTARYYFSEPTPLFYEDEPWESSTRRERLEVLGKLTGKLIPGAATSEEQPFIISTVRAQMTRTIPRREFIKYSRLVKLGQVIQPNALLNFCTGIGYEPADVVSEQGHFSRRGGILDIWVPMETMPIRIEFLGDTIDTLRHFDPSTQRTLNHVDSFLIVPAREVLSVKAEGIELHGRKIDEFALPLIHSYPASMLDYLPKDALILIDDIELCRTLGNELEEQAFKTRDGLIQEGFIDGKFPAPYLSWSELYDTLETHRWLELGHSTSEEPSQIASAFYPGERFAGHLKLFNDHLLNISTENEKAVIISRQKIRLKELWDEISRDAINRQPPVFLEGTLSEGWVAKKDDGSALHLITDSEIFGWARPQPRQRFQQTIEIPEDAYADLQAGDWVVHSDFGVGKYTGLVRRQLEGTEREFLCIEYQGGDQIFVPIHQADRLTRYIGPDESPPSATHLGSSDWSNSKQQVKEAVRLVAKELLDLYALRQLAQGYAFGKDTAWQKELESSFPYIETTDQSKAILETKQDMETPRPMDRLLCGDVGYGKTEVALRAAFKAVMDGKQVAMLVPTTVLAQQHYETFQQRLAAYPVVVEMLSRFRQPKAQDEILLKLGIGEIDIVIGTHRLIQVDVQFKDLGLVIIDEEQRFGVAHKEHFKKLRTEVDVLTLTATPIPRTLYMALTGVRDISVINTPPAERLPVVTHIGPYSPKIVRQAALRELDRGGQVFFLHNRVHTIHAMEHHLHSLIPEARIGIAHGQMPEQELALVMHQFTQGEIDILLCTSIIESGLDIPNANTLIVDRGDTFGLAQLYQLRGRVGRGAQRAYAYFFRHKRRPPTNEGQERLEIIAENTQLGSGYSIAMRDLEMRGAGDLLGTRQHGYIASVGFHLYSRMLAQTVREVRKDYGMKGLPIQDKAFKELRNLVSVDLPVSIGIPLDYIEGQQQRLRLYRRIASLISEDEIDTLADEFKDRFGELPDVVKNLFFYIRVKVRAEMAGLASVTAEGDQIVLRFPSSGNTEPARKLPVIGKTRPGKNAYWLPFRATDESWREELLNILVKIIDLEIAGY
jgi:transcription-repair coupling factor (superfamily II helicase)